MELPKFRDLIDIGIGEPSTYIHTDHAGIQVDCKIVSVDDIAQTFNAFLNVHLHYRLTDEEAAREENRAIVGPDPNAGNSFQIVANPNIHFFVPTITMNNCIDSNNDDFIKTIRVNKHTGDVWAQYENYCTIFENLELRKFPYDRQVFRVYLNTLGIGVLPWHIPVPSADYPETKTPQPGTEKKLLKFEAKNWKLRGKKIDLTGMAAFFDGGDHDLDFLIENQRGKDHDVRVTFMMDRNQYYYQSNYIVISAFLAFGTSSVFLIPANNVEERQSLSITILLAMVALKFALSSNTPVIGYNTYMDIFLLTWYGMLFLSIFWNFAAAAYVLYKCDNDLADEECLIDEQQEIRDVEAYVAFFYIGLWTLIIIVMLRLGVYKDDYKTTMGNQTDAPKKKSDGMLSMATYKASDVGEEKDE